MPFEPRIVSNDDDGRLRAAARARHETDDFESPDLEVLAAQLSDDAAYLAKLYPPRTIPGHVLERNRRWHLPAAARWRTAAAAVLLAGAGAGFGLWAALQSSPIGQGNQHQVAVRPAPSGTVVDEPARDVPVQYQLAAGTSANPSHFLIESEHAGLEPADLLQELSVPEQEAVFDLLEAEPVQLARISL